MDTFNSCDLDVTAILTVEEREFLDSLPELEDTDGIDALSAELDNYFDLDFE